MSGPMTAKRGCAPLVACHGAVQFYHSKVARRV